MRGLASKPQGKDKGTGAEAAVDNSQLRQGACNTVANKASMQLRALASAGAPVSAKCKGISQARNQSQSICPLPQQLVDVGLGQRGHGATSISVAVLTAGVAGNPIHPAAAAPAGVSGALEDEGREGQGREDGVPPPPLFHHTPTQCTLHSSLSRRRVPPLLSWPSQPQQPDGGHCEGLFRHPNSIASICLSQTQSRERR